LVEYWRDHYDWRPVERRLKAYPQYTTVIDGLDIHFLHIRSSHQGAIPMVMTHGWPGSILEFERVIAPLVDPTSHGGTESDAFHLVIPSLPGHGFSGKPTEQGWGAERTAAAWAALMERLGYRQWVAHGHDWGSLVTHWLAALRPAGLIAGHTSWPLVFPETPPQAPDPEERMAYDDVAGFVNNSGGYQHLQATRPQTVGYALADSPVGQAMWIYEKFAEWSDHPGDVSRQYAHPLANGDGVSPSGTGGVEDVLGLDAILDGITLYWLTNSAASSARFYWENARARRGTDLSFGVVDLPMSGTVFPKDMYRPPRHWAQAAWPGLVHWGTAPAGGHFSPWEQPAVTVSELRQAFRDDRVRSRT
jgi:epoxide hydrolase